MNILSSQASVTGSMVNPMSASLQSQRRRLRVWLGQLWAREGKETYAQPSETLHDQQFCSECQAISAKLETLLELADGSDSHWKSFRRGKVVTYKGGLDHVAEKPRTRCSLCLFLAHMVEAYGARDGIDLSLFIGSANREYRVDRAQVAPSLVLWVAPTLNKHNWYPACSEPSAPSAPFKREGFTSDGTALELSNDPGKISGRLVGPQTNFDLVRSWFDHCATHHGNTCHKDPSRLTSIPGVRVIDCLSRRLVGWSALPESQDRQYVALSYVWGDGEGKLSWSARTRKAFMEIMGHKTVKAPETNLDWTPNGGGLPSDLPRLIEDTITAVVKLGFTYLWVDRYCIPQNDAQAKHTQIQNMDHIYGSASLTIIAAAGDDPSYGLPGVSPRNGRLSESLSTCVQIGSRRFVTVDTGRVGHEEGEILSSKWNSRAWTMQESFLSCRCLVFLEDGAYFQCNSPRSYRLEALHEPQAVLQFRHEVLSREEDNGVTPPDSVILTKAGRGSYLKLDWCLQLVEDYFQRDMTFEMDSLNAFSGILMHLESLEPPVHNLWGVLILPVVVATTSSGQRIRYSLASALAWSYTRSRHSADNGHGKLEQPTILPRKGMFPSWTWADWRRRTALAGEDFTSEHQLQFPLQDENYLRFISLVDLSAELDDGSIVSLSQGDDSDISWLTKLRSHPRILHINGYTSNPQLRYMTEAEWQDFWERSVLPPEHEDNHEDDRGSSEHHPPHCRDHDWVLIDSDGEHLQLPLERPDSHRYPRCWSTRRRTASYDLTTDAYHFQRQRGYPTKTIKRHTESTFDFRIILLGHNTNTIYYMVLMKAPGTGGHAETFERVNVITDYEPRETERMEEFLAKLTGKHANSFPGTPWVKMSTRVA